MGMFDNLLRSSTRRGASVIGSRIANPQRGSLASPSLQSNPLQMGPPTLGYDSDVYADINDIRQETLNAIAEYEQQRNVADAEADFERRRITGEIATSSLARQLGLQGANSAYDQLGAALQGSIGSMQQAYNQGVQGVGEGFQQAQNAVVDSPIAQQLEQQLAAISGETDGLSDSINRPSSDYRALLANAGATGQSNLSALASGDIAAGNTARSGYDAERGQSLSDINLTTDALLRTLENERGAVYPEFIPFNLADLLLRERGSIRDAIAAGTARSEQQRQEEQDRMRYTGSEGARQYADSIGRPDLYDWFSENSSIAQASGEPFEQVMHTLLTSIGGNIDFNPEAVKNQYNNNGGIDWNTAEGAGIGPVRLQLPIPSFRGNPGADAQRNFGNVADRIGNIVGSINQASDTVATRDSEQLRRLIDIYLGRYANYA